LDMTEEAQECSPYAGITTLKTLNLNKWGMKFCYRYAFAIKIIWISQN